MCPLPDNQKTLQLLQEYYDNLYSMHGMSTESLGWSPQGQATRFAEVARSFPENTGSVLDIGCGFGQLEPVLRNRHPEIRYTGWDINANMLSHCTTGRLATFEQRNILEAPPSEGEHEVVVLIGALNTAFGDNDRTIRAMLAAMYAACSRMCILSATSAYADPEYKHESMWFYDPIDLFTFSRTLTRYVDLRHGYLPHDMMLVLYKP